MPYRQPDGTVSLNILNPDGRSSMTVGALAGPLKSGAVRLPRFEDRVVKMDNASGMYHFFSPDFVVIWVARWRSGWGRSHNGLW